MKFHPCRTVLLIALPCLGLLACTPETGSDPWCEAMQEKPRGDWTMNETAEFARHCLLPDATTGGTGSERWCDTMREKPRGEWSINGAVDFVRHCLFTDTATGEP